MDTTWFDFETDYPDIAGPVSRILKQRDNAPVSYTHLTLPTSDLV